jgi:hypothetical protein
MSDDRNFMGERGDQGQRGVAGERGPKGDHGQHGEIGAVGPQGERGKDAKSWRLWPTLRLLAFLLVAAASMFAAARTYDIAAENKATIERVEANAKAVEREGVERRNQICLSDEREHLNEVQQLKNTYLYLVNLPDSEVSSTFNRFIISQVPKTEDEAKIDTAPDFCDKPGAKAEKDWRETDGKKGAPPVGLPEPDPVVPERPDKVDDLIQQLAKDRPVLQRP